MRKWLVVGIALPYVVLSIYDMTHGRWRTGVASGLLAIVNTILYWG